MKREFNKNKLIIYSILNMILITLLIIGANVNIQQGIWGDFVFALLLLMLIVCLYLLFEFITSIPNTSARLASICVGSGLLLCLIIMSYANMYLQIHQLNGDNSFTGKNLTWDDFLYYSITTFTTTGYGDISSIGKLSNFVAASEMLVGFFSNTILMAILTAKLIQKLK